MGRRVIATPERVRAAMDRLRLDGVEITYRNGRVFGLSEVRGATGGGTDRVRALVLLVLAEEGIRIPREMIREARGRVSSGGAPAEFRAAAKTRRVPPLSAPGAPTPRALPAPDPTLDQIRDMLTAIRHDVHALLDFLTATLQFAIATHPASARPDVDGRNTDGRMFSGPTI